APSPDVTPRPLTAGATPGRLAAAAAAGAGGFLAKDGAFSDILAAIRSPMPGKMVIEGATLHELIKNMPGPPQPAPAQPGPAQPGPEPAQREPGAEQVSGQPDAARLTAREQ